MYARLGRSCRRRRRRRRCLAWAVLLLLAALAGMVVHGGGAWPETAPLTVRIAPQGPPLTRNH